MINNVKFNYYNQEIDQEMHSKDNKMLLPINITIELEHYDVNCDITGKKNPTIP